MKLTFSLFFYFVCSVYIVNAQKIEAREFLGIESQDSLYGFIRQISHLYHIE